MKNPIKIFVLILMALPFFSCENEIQFNEDEVQTLMVMNGYLSPDSIVKVHLAKSKFFLQDDSKFENITNATVKLWVNDELKGTLSNAGGGFYLFNYIPKSGDKIKILASSVGFSDVYSEEEIPRAVPVVAIDTFWVPLSDDYSLSMEPDGKGGYVPDTIGINHYGRFKVNITFKDSLNFNNYYMLNVRFRETHQDGKQQFVYLRFYTDDIVFGNKSIQNDLIDMEIMNQYYEFNDDLLNGSAYTLSFYSNINNYEVIKDIYNDYGNGLNPVVKKEYIVELVSVSKSYYLYMKSRDALNNSDDMFSEPVQVHSNVVGGIGLVGGYNVFSKSISVPLGYSVNNFIYSPF